LKTETGWVKHTTPDNSDNSWRLAQQLSAIRD